MRMSTQEIADAFGLAKRPVVAGLNRLRELGALVDEERGAGSVPHRFRVVSVNGTR
jgi:hypothetical protein